MGSPRLFSLPPSSLFPFSPFFVLLLPPLLSSRLSTLSVLSLSTCTKTITANRTQMVVSRPVMLSLPPMRKALVLRWNDDLGLGFIAAIRSERYPLREDTTLTVFFRTRIVSQNSHETAKFKKQGKLKINRNTRVVIVEERGEREVSGWI